MLVFGGREWLQLTQGGREDIINNSWNDVEPDDEEEVGQEWGDN